MCHWHYAIYTSEDFDEELACFPFAGGVRPEEADRARVLERVRRQAAGYVNAHPESRESLRIVEMSCNGPQRVIYPYAPGGERRLSVGGWEGLPGEEEPIPTAELEQMPSVARPLGSRGLGLLDGLPPLREQRDLTPVRAASIEEDLSETAFVALVGGRQVAVFANEGEAIEALSSLSTRPGLVVVEVDEHGECLRKLRPCASEYEPAAQQDGKTACFKRPLRDGWEEVAHAFDSFALRNDAVAAALERLKTWAAIASQDVRGGGRANDEQVDVRASVLYSLRHALRALEAAEGRLLVGHDDHWQPYPVKSVATLPAARSEVERLERDGQKAAVYMIEASGAVGERLYPVEERRYTVWSMATANLLGEYESADEAIRVAREDSDDLVAFLDEEGSAPVPIYDPQGLVGMTASARRERLRLLGRPEQSEQPFAREGDEPDG